MIEKIVSKILILITITAILFVFLPMALNFKLYAVEPLNKENQKMLVYTRSILFEQIELMDQLLVNDKDNSLFLSKVKQMDTLNNMVQLENNQWVLASAILGKRIILLPYLGEAYTFFYGLDYYLKLTLLSVLLGLLVLPELLKKVMKKGRFHFDKMIQ